MLLWQIQKKSLIYKLPSCEEGVQTAVLNTFCYVCVRKICMENMSENMSDLLIVSDIWMCYTKGEELLRGYKKIKRGEKRWKITIG